MVVRRMREAVYRNVLCKVYLEAFGCVWYSIPGLAVHDGKDDSLMIGRAFLARTVSFLLGVTYVSFL